MNTLALFAVLAISQAPAPPAEMNQLKPFHGTWSGDVQIKPPGSPGFGGPATWKISPVIDGLYVQIELAHEIKGMGVVRGTTMLNWDQEAGKFRSFTFSNNPAELGKPRNELVTLKGSVLEYPLADGGGGIQFGQSFEVLPNGRMKFVMRMVHGGKETLIANGELTKS